MKLPDGVSSLVYRDDDGREIVRKLQPDWIPVSERLPEDGKYLICTDDGYIATVMYDRDMGWLLKCCNIVAYMPLPEPYTPQESEDVNER